MIFMVTHKVNPISKNKPTPKVPRMSEILVFKKHVLTFSSKKLRLWHDLFQISLQSIQN